MLSELLLGLQIIILMYFCYFGVYNYIYSFASLKRIRLKTTTPSNKKVAVVIVSFNEKEVLADTIKSCEELSYQNKVIIVGDDSNDGQTYPFLLSIAQQKKCKPLHDAPFINHEKTEVLESPDFVIFHRKTNEGFKAGNLKELERYLHARGFEYMFLLDADYRPQKNAIERSLAILEADNKLAFVQTKREYYHGTMNHLQRCLTLNEESCYFVDLIGRQALNDPILFTGCCTLFRLKHLADAEGFRPGHLTEDIDLTNRIYLLGHKGAYLPTVKSEGEVPPNYQAYRKQQERWAMGTAHTLRDHFSKIVKSKKLTLKEKLGLIRQDGYYSSAVAIELSILLALCSLFFLSANTDNYQAVLYRYYLQYIGLPYTILLFLALASNFLPLLITIVKKKEYENLIFIPYATWLSWSLLHTYFIANIKVFLRKRQNWFLTPKTNRKNIRIQLKKSHTLKIANAATLAMLITVYWLEWSKLGWLDPYAFFWIPSLVVGVVHS
ncbi:glycosyltransferase [Candidatus Woesearchaeota archaeon]|nr:glycosyltransferase [Candidatus Woesearchaeota archaeon]